MAKRLNPASFNQWIYDIIDDYSTPIEVFYGGAGSGKSYGAMQKILLKALNRSRKVLVIRKVGATLKDSAFSLMRELLSISGFLRVCNINRSDLEITLHNGSLFLFKGLDDPEKIKSINGITDIIIEEATELTIEDFTQLVLRLRPNEPEPQIYLMFNPVSKQNWVYDYFFVHPPNNVKIMQTSYRDNRFLPDSYVQTLESLKTRNPAYYRIYALGEFATLDKLVFPTITKKLIDPATVAQLPLWAGLDFGYVNDPSALIWGRYDVKNGIIYTTGEYWRKGMTNEDIGNVIRACGLAKERIIADSAEPKSIDELKRNGFYIYPASKGRDSVVAGIDFILRHELVVDERCKQTIEEYENYTWKKDKKSGEYINEPVDLFNHCLDATRYGLTQFWKPGAKITFY